MTRRLFPQVILVPTVLVALSFPALRADDDPTLASFVEAANQIPKETEAGTILADREMARSLVKYGLDHEKPEAILTGVEILHKNPVKPAKETAESKQAAEADLAQLKDWVELAADMRPDDDVVLEMVDRVSKVLSQKSRGLAAGPQQWIVEIEKGGYFELDPGLIYNQHEKAVLTAYAADNTILGVSVRRGDLKKIYAHGVGQGKVSASWNAGIYTTDWFVRIYNVVGPGTKTVRIETN